MNNQINTEWCVGFVFELSLDLCQPFYVAIRSALIERWKRAANPIEATGANEVWPWVCPR